MLYSKLGPDRCIEVIGLRWFAPMLYGQTTDKTELKTDPFPACSQSGRRCNQIRQINVIHPASIGLVQEQLSSHKPFLHDYHTLPFRILFINQLAGSRTLRFMSHSAELFIAHRLQTWPCALPLLDPLCCERREIGQGLKKKSWQLAGRI